MDEFADIAEEADVDFDDLYEEGGEGDISEEEHHDDFFKEETPHTQQEAKLKAKIGKIENEMLRGEKPWQMTGEVDAKARPADSVLDEYLEFDRQTKVSVPITVEHTERIEALVRRRIKDKAFDDVERKVKPSDDFTPKVKLNFEKNEKGLADIYADSYLRAVDGPSSETPTEKARNGVKDAMRTLFKKLNALSHSLYTPTPALPELKIVSNLPTMAVEEVAQVADGTCTTEHKLLAPEEVAARPRQLKANEEMDKGERKKLRKKQKSASSKRKHAQTGGGETSAKRKRSFDEKQILKKAERLLKKTPNMRIAEREMAKPKIRKLLA